MKRCISKDDLSAKAAELSKKNGNIEEYLALVEKWRDQEQKFELYLRDHEYDGVLGEPLPWVPEHIRNQFFEARISLFDNTIDIVNKPHNPGHIKMDMNYKLAGEGPYQDPGEGWSTWGSPSYVKDRDLYIRDFKVLLRLWILVQKGKDKALREMTGEKAFPEYENIINRERQSASAKKRIGKEGVLKTAVRKLECVSLENLLTKLEDSERIDDIFAADNPDNRIDINAIEVHREEEFISYSTRKGKAKRAAFKTLKNHITNIKKNTT